MFYLVLLISLFSQDLEIKYYVSDNLKNIDITELEKSSFCKNSNILYNSINSKATAV